MTTPTDDELLALAKKATPGPWREGTANVWRDTMVICDLGRGTRYVYEQGRRIPVSGNDEKWQDDAAYIAAANPAAIIALIERHRAEVAALEKWRDDALETFYNICVKALGWTDPRTHHSDIPPPEWTQGKISDGVKAEMDKLRAEVERLHAEIHEMQDGALLRDLKAQVERLTRENHNLSAGQKHALESCWAAESALAAERKRCGELEGALHSIANYTSSEWTRDTARAALAGKDAEVTNDQKSCQPAGDSRSPAER